MAQGWRLQYLRAARGQLLECPRGGNAISSALNHCLGLALQPPHFGSAFASSSSSARLTGIPLSSVTTTAHKNSSWVTTARASAVDADFIGTTMAWVSSPPVWRMWRSREPFARPEDRHRGPPLH